MGATVAFENERVRVLRVKHAGRERQPQISRGYRLIIYLNDGHVMRTENGKQEKIRRKTGDVAWREPSKHQIENLTTTSHEIIIVELKP